MAVDVCLPVPVRVANYYPPIGALADSIGGLAGARILSLSFMLGATILLCWTASRLIGRTGALFAAALWALSEPAMRLAFATYDPCRILDRLGGVAHRASRLPSPSRRVHPRGRVALAVANLTAYPGIVIDPLVIAFASLAWLPACGGKNRSRAPRG